MESGSSEAQKIEERKVKNRPFLAALVGALSACFFTAMSIITKTIYTLYPSAGVYTQLFFRSVGVLVFMVPFVGWRHW